MKFSFRFLTPVLAAIGLALASAPAALAAEATGEPIRIPMMESFSGAAADWGEDMWTGAVAAQKIINMRGGIKGRPLEFYKADAPYDDLPTAVSMFKKLARDPNVTMIFDGGATSVIAAVHDLTGDAKLPLFAFSSGGFWRMGHFNPWVFRALPQAYTALPVLLPKAKKKFGIKKAALIYTHDDEAEVANAIVWRDLAKQNGIEIVEVTNKTKETDFSAQLTRVKAAKVDAFFVALQAFDGGTMMAQARDMGLKQPVLGTMGSSNKDYWKMSKGKVAEEHGGPTILYSNYDPTDPRPYVQDIKKMYKEHYGTDPTTWAALTADAAFVTAQILNRATDLTREGIRKAFAETGAIESLSGVIGWDGSGDAIRDSVLFVKWVDGRLVPVRDEYWDDTGS